MADQAVHGPGGTRRDFLELVTWSTDRRIHASGHAHRAEQERMIAWTEPRAFLPIHGALHHLVRHAELARERGVGDVAVAENGHVMELGADGLLARGGRVPVGRVALGRSAAGADARGFAGPDAAASPTVAAPSEHRW